MDWFQIALAVFRIAMAGVIIGYGFLTSAGRGEDLSIRRAGLAVALLGTVSGVFDLVVLTGGPARASDDVIASVLTAANWVGIVWFFRLVSKHRH